LSYYHIPQDPIYLTVGPILREDDRVKITQFRFIANISRGTIEISGEAEFSIQSQHQYFEFYLPFRVQNVLNYSPDMRIRPPDIHRDTVGGECSLVHLSTIQRYLGSRAFDFVLYVEGLIAARQLGEERIILTFGYPSDSARYESLESYVGEGSRDISQLIPLTVSIVVDERSFFSSETYPPPEVQYLTAEHRIATWLVDFSGPLSNYYRSIDCTVTHMNESQTRQFFVFLSGMLVGSGVSFFSAWLGWAWLRKESEASLPAPSPVVGRATSLDRLAVFTPPLVLVGLLQRPLPLSFGWHDTTRVRTDSVHARRSFTPRTCPREGI
jgi:hypothetical protein